MASFTSVFLIAPRWPMASAARTRTTGLEDSRSLMYLGMSAFLGMSARTEPKATIHIPMLRVMKVFMPALPPLTGKDHDNLLHGTGKTRTNQEKNLSRHHSPV